MIPLTTEAMRLLHEGALTLSRIEANGVRVNVEYLEKVTNETSIKIKEVENEIRQDPVYKTWRKRFGDKTNIGSRTQLVELVFGKQYLGYEVKGHTDKGRIAANKDALDDIDEPIVQKILLVENLKKTQNTYLTGIRKEMVKHGPFWYVHSFYNLHTISTYRSSSNSPNFQNVPKRNPEMSALIRPNYMPHPGHLFVEVDFSQLEIRIAKCYNGDPNLGRYIEDPTTDMHRDTAMDLFFLSKKLYELHKDYFKKTARDSSKNQFVFPQTYGSNYVNCAKNIWKAMKQRSFMCGSKTMFQHLEANGIKERGDCIQGVEPRPGSFEAHLKKVERIMWEKRFVVWTEWKKKRWAEYQRDGGFSMYTGFAVNGLFKRNDVICYPIQGSAFHCLLWCLIQLDKWLRKYKMRSKIIGEIHDAGQFSVHPAELQDFLNKIYQIMTVDLPNHYRWIDVPLEVEADVAEVDDHWLNCKQWTAKDNTWSLKV